MIWLDAHLNELKLGVSFQTSGVDDTKSGQTKLAEITQWYYYNQDQQGILISILSTMDISLDAHSQQNLLH